MSVSISIIASKTLEIAEEAARYEQEIVDKVRQLVSEIEGVQSAQVTTGQGGTVDLTPEQPQQEAPPQTGEQPQPPSPAPGAEQPQPGPTPEPELTTAQPPDGSAGNEGTPEAEQG